MINLHASHPEPIYLQSTFHLLLLYFTLNPPWRGKASGYCWKCWHRRCLVTSLIFQEEEVVGTLEERPDGRKILQSSLGTNFIQPREVKASPSGRGTRKSPLQTVRDLSVVTTVSDIPNAQCGRQNNGFPAMGLATWGLALSILWWT